MDNLQKTTHPLILVAAVSVSLASLAAVAHFTGLLPVREATSAAIVATAPAVAPAPVAAPVVQPPALVAAPPVAAIEQPAPAPVKKAVVRAPAPRPAAVVRAPRDEPRQPGDGDYRRVSTPQSNDSGIDVFPARSANNAPPVPPVCQECGTVESVREIATQGEGSGLGAVAGGVVGGLLGNQTGRGKGKDVMTVLGAVGGAFAGHQVEKHVRSDKQLEVTVRFDNGSVRTYNQTSATGWRNGDRVRLDNGSLARL